MQHQRDAHRLPARGRPARAGAAVAEAGSVSAGDVREIDAAALEEVAFLDQPRNAAAAFRALPGVAAEGLAVEGLERGDDAALQAGEVILEVGGVHGVSAKEAGGQCRRTDDAGAISA